MSVSYSTRFGYGFVISYNEYKDLDKDKMILFQESDYALRLDGWSYTSDYFFGIEIKSVEPGQYLMIPPVTPYVHDEFMDALKEFKDIFPNRKDYIPHNYVLSCVD